MTKSFILFILILLSALPALSQSWKGTIKTENGIAIVNNPYLPIFPDGSYTLKEEITIGGNSQNIDASLNLFASVFVDSNGTMYIPDMKYSNIKIFNMNGVFLSSFGKRGQGPGEFRLLSELLVNPANLELYAIDVMRVSVFSSDYRFIRSYNLSERWEKSAIDSSGHIVAESAYKDQNLSFRRLKRYENIDSTGVPIKSWQVLNELKPSAFPPRGIWGMDPSGNIYYGFSDKYEIDVFDNSNHLIKKIIKKEKPRKVTKEDRDRFTDNLPAALRGQAYIFENFFSYFINIIVDEKGRMLINTGNIADKLFRYHLFDENGRYLANMDFAWPIIFFGNNKVYSRETNSEGYLLLKRYDLRSNRLERY